MGDPVDYAIGWSTNLECMDLIGQSGLINLVNQSGWSAVLGRQSDCYQSIRLLVGRVIVDRLDWSIWSTVGRQSDWSIWLLVDRSNWRIYLRNLRGESDGWVW